MNSDIQTRGFEGFSFVVVIIFDSKVAENLTNNKTSFLFLLTVFLRPLSYYSIFYNSVYSPLITTSQYSTLFLSVLCKFGADTFIDPHKVSCRDAVSAARFRSQWVNWERPKHFHCVSVNVC